MPASATEAGTPSLRGSPALNQKTALFFVVKDNLV
jgi:hypothetical protein